MRCGGKVDVHQSGLARARRLELYEGAENKCRAVPGFEEALTLQGKRTDR
jgi:hypothetical protein